MSSNSYSKVYIPIKIGRSSYCYGCDVDYYNQNEINVADRISIVLQVEGILNVKNIINWHVHMNNIKNDVNRKVKG
jgi:hypothetical protein